MNVPPPPELDPWDAPTMVTGVGANPETAAAVWRERERRQRTIRLLMMFLVMLLLMDGEDGAQRRQHSAMRKRLAKKNLAADKSMEHAVYTSRLAQEEQLQQLASKHARYAALIKKNGGENVEKAVRSWAQQQAEQEKDEFGASTSAQQRSRREQQAAAAAEDDIETDRKVFHYPWNSTGFYRGEWSRQNVSSSTTSLSATAEDAKKSLAPIKSKETETAVAVTSTATTAPNTNNHPKAAVVMEAPALEERMLQALRGHNNKNADPFRVMILPTGMEIAMRDDNNLTSMKWEDMRTDTTNALIRAIRDETTDGVANRARMAKKINAAASAVETKTDGSSPTTTTTKKEEKAVEQPKPIITLTRNSGRAAFQLFSRSVPCMKELSIVEGFVKLYDSTSPGYSTRKDILLRVRGVLIHAIGRMSLVSNVAVSRTALVIDSGSDKKAAVAESSSPVATAADGGADNHNDKNSDDEDNNKRRRRLMEVLEQVDTENINDAHVEMVRDEAVALFADSVGEENPEWSLTSPGFEQQHDHRRLNQVESPEPVVVHKEKQASSQSQKTKETTTSGGASPSSNNGEASVSVPPVGSEEEKKGDEPKKVPAWSDIVLPYPFVRDNERETVRRTKTPAARMMPAREQALEANAAGCGFEISLDVGEEEWTVGAWRKLVGRRVDEVKKLDPSNRRDDADLEDERDNMMHLRGARPKPIQDQALVMTMVGTIHSPNCNFTANLNATALRTDWEATQSRAINYSFVMMLVCLTQILILLRQLLHSQGQSAATRVSLLCIGWQTLIDALLCLEHIYLSLSIQQLFSAFASVSFFKLLIFCIIEMKYMGIIIQARNSSNGGQVTTEQLRRQIAMLHLRFYCAMAGSFLLFFYVGDKYRIFYMLALYSFWVPQIIMNVITEAKAPMHRAYIYGMSLTRLVAPFYLFGIRNNFLREVYPEAPYDPFTCQMVFLWVGIQTAVLIGQSKYGARFLIPARFLPPKFDYSRPIPASMLPPGAAEAMAQVETNLMMEDREDTLRGGSSGGGARKKNEDLTSSAPPSRGRHTTSVTTRSRRKNRTNRSTECGMTTEDHQGSGAVLSSRTPSPTPLHTLECSICYEGIDVRKRHDYMLAPCNHLFHRECLVQWMDVKMECPICRTELPAL